MRTLADGRPQAGFDIHGGAVAQLGERLVRNEEVSGSIPLGSTSLRSLRELRLGRPSDAFTRYLKSASGRAFAKKRL
jgi:hypothetical protein